MLAALGGVPLIILSHAGTSGLPLLPFGIVGFVVARRQPRNPIGWVMLALALDFLLTSDAGEYAYLVYRQGYDLPFGRAAAFVAVFWVWLVALAPLPIALFPDGRFPGRWLWVIRAYLGACALLVARFTWQGIDAIAGQHIRVDDQGAAVVRGSDGGGPFAVVLVAFLIAFVARQVVGYRSSRGEQRQQLKWLLTGGAVTVVGLFVTLTFGGSHNGELKILGGAGFLMVSALPVGLGIAILKYRLYDIDRLISRTISYTLVTGTLAGVFIGIVVLTTDVLPFSSPVGVAASTLAAAALFNPLRRRSQRIVDRRFNRARYDAESIVAAFATSLRSAVSVEAVRTELLQAVGQAVEPAQAWLWISRPQAAARR